MVDMDAIFIAVSLIVFIWDTAQPIFAGGNAKRAKRFHCPSEILSNPFLKSGANFFSNKNGGAAAPPSKAPFIESRGL
ncbi:MAG: hypothetical protein L7U45_00930 [Alphaproteobacteria bacterium]|nr:hypothetical protein [Alphaproteobacteria bacterium]